MTTKPAEPEKQEELQLKTPGEPGTLASKLETPHPVFSGHPASDAPFEPETPPEGGEPEGAKPPETPEAPVSAEPPETPPAGAEPPKAPERKFKSWDEAEKAEKEHQRLARVAAEEAATLRKENEELKKRLEKPEEPAASPEPAAKPTVKTQEELEAEAQSRIETALDEIGQLDEFSSTYKKDVAKAWAKAGFGGRGQAAIPDIESIVDERVNRALEAREAKTSEVNVRDNANAAAREAGLDMAEDSIDYIAFWHYAKSAPEAPFAEQVKWTIDEVKRRKGAPAAVTPQEREKVKQEQLTNAPLERGGAPPPAQPPAAQSRRSLNTIIEEGKSARII